MSEPRIGLLAEFATAEQLLAAVVRVRREQPAAGHIEAYSPFPVEGLAEALGARHNSVPRWMLLGALVGGIGTCVLEWYAAVVNYPINVGGRPYASWPAFLPPAIEITLLGAALGGVLGMLIGSGLPRLRHPLFEVPAFARASSDRFFLLLRAQGESFDRLAARRVLESLAPLAITEVSA